MTWTVAEPAMLVILVERGLATVAVLLVGIKKSLAVLGRPGNATLAPAPPRLAPRRYVTPGVAYGKGERASPYREGLRMVGRGPERGLMGWRDVDTGAGVLSG
jgi:hypothetical protein